MSKKNSKSPKLLDYIERVDSDLYNIISDLCLENIFIPKIGTPGLTFLLPIDKKFRSQLFELCNSNNLEDADTAVKMISALLITDLLKTPADFMEKRDDIPNTLGQRLEIEGIKGLSILIKPGLEIKIDDRFKDNSKINKLAVWTLNNGGININGPEASLKYIKKNKTKNGEKESHVENGTDNLNNIRMQIANNVEDDYKKIMSNNLQYRDVFLETTLSLISFMLKNEYCKELLINKIIPLLSFDKTDFYILFEPYKTTGPYLISYRILNDWINERKIVKFKNVLDDINNLLNNTKDNKALIYSNAQGALNVINEKRNKLINTKMAPQNMVANIKKIYEELFKSNIFPQDLIDFYSNSSYKLFEDEFRFVIYQQFNRLESNYGYSFDENEFKKILNFIYDYTNGPYLKPIIFKETKNLIPSSEKVAEIKIFINSTHFFYIPISFKTMEAYPHEFVLNKPGPYDTSSIFNISKLLKDRCLMLMNKIAVNNEPEKITENKELSSSSSSSSSSDDTMKIYLKKLKDEGRLDEFLKKI